MKVIDLLNKIANGEEVPKKIRIAGWCYKFEWIEYRDNYYDKNADIDLMSCLSMCEDEFNREVEIIEDKKIKHIGKIYDLTKFHIDYPEVAEMLKEIGDKQYEIIDILNKGDNNENI